MITDPQTATGRQLQALLPEVYRSRDNGDLAGLLDGLGHLLDRVRATLEQRLADSFPDEPLDGLACQPWLLPYFAELVDARLVSPDPSGQRAEVANAIGWRQTKGTLASVEQVAQDVGRFEVEVQEGWRRVAVTPRTGWSLPSRSTGRPGADPFAVDRPPGTVAFGLHARAVQPKNPDDPAAHRFLTRDLRWRQANPHGAPCFPGSYEDPSARTVDMRSPDWRKGHHHPRRLLLYFPPPAGFFQPGATPIQWSDWEEAAQDLDDQIATLNQLDTDVHAIGDGRVIERLQPQGSPALYRIRRDEEVQAERTTGTEGAAITRLRFGDRWLEESLDSAVRELRSLGDVVQIEGDVELEGEKTWIFEKVAILGEIAVPEGRLVLRGAAAESVVSGNADLEDPAVDAAGSLLGSLSAAGLARLEFVTVLGALAAGRLQASDAILGGAVTVPKVTDPKLDHCVRYSRIDAATANVVMRYCASSAPLYVELDFDDGRRPAAFGEPGCGVLHPACPRAVRSGAEDGGEMGAFHDRRYALALEAVSTKLQDFLPLGLDAILIPDSRLHGVPPALKT
ncbi:MAG: phage tail protein [Acidobacteriota bacterium]